MTSKKKLHVIKGLRKREKGYRRSRTPVLVYLDRSLYLTAKSLAHQQGRSIRDVMETLLQGWTEEQPAWREFLATLAADAPKGRHVAPRPPAL